MHLLVVLVAVCMVLLSLTVIGLIVVAVLLWQAVNNEARKRGLLDMVDLLHRRKKWYG